MEPQNVNLLFMIYTVATAFVAYVFIGATYRLFLSPLAKFPGPRLAAVSFW